MATFSFTIHRLSPGKPVYNIISTPMEGWKTKSRLKSTDPQRTWDVEIYGRTNSEKDSIISHYDGQNGFNLPFNWLVVPNFFTGGVDTTYYVRYKELTYTNPKGMGNIWEFTITFIEEL